MSTVNGVPAHVLLVHAVVVLLPLAAGLLVLCSAWPAARARLAGPNDLLAAGTLALVPVTTGAGERLQARVGDTELVRDHAELGGSALLVAVPVAVLALVVWWRERESRTLAARAGVETSDLLPAERSPRPRDGPWPPPPVDVTELTAVEQQALVEGFDQLLSREVGDVTFE